MSHYYSTCEILIAKRKELLSLAEFLNSFRKKRHFIWKRAPTIYHVVIYLLFSSKASMFQNMTGIMEDLPCINFPDVTKQALSKARQGILPSLFQNLFRLSVQTYYELLPVRKTWRGYHVFAVDGSRIEFPNSKSNFKNYDEMFDPKNQTAGTPRHFRPVCMMFWKICLSMPPCMTSSIRNAKPPCSIWII